MGVAMRGDDEICGRLFSYIDLEKRVRRDHPLRVIRQIANAALKSLSGEFEKLYSPIGRESIPPERLMRALLLQAFYSIRSERQLVERIDTDLLFRWFVGLGIEDVVWDATSFTKNRDRLLQGEVASQFLAAVLSQDKVKRLLSSEHFSVDGTLLEAWASPKSFRPKDGSGEPPGPGRNGERLAALALIAPHADRPQPVTLGGDKGYDAGDFVMELREKAVTPHVAQNTNGRRSAIDGRTTRHSGYAVSQRIRKRVEEAFGWAKTVAGLRKMRHRGLPKVGWQFTLAMAAYDLVRLPKLLAQPTL